MIQTQTTTNHGDALGDFKSLGLGDGLQARLKALSYDEPTSIQTQAIPKVASGCDLIGMAATGTGKTAAYLLPLIERLEGERTKGVQVLILVPTRELASQVAESIKKYSPPALKDRVALLYGGQSYGPQLDSLRRNASFVVGTPGRIMDHLRRGSLVLSQVSSWVLDEADEMLDMGFAEDIEAIAKYLPAEKQTLFFSATMPPHVATLAKRFLKDPVIVRVEKPVGLIDAVPLVRQGVYHVDRARKVAALIRVLELEQPEAALIFCRTRDEVDLLCHNLRFRHAEALHGGLSQAQREKILARLRTKATSLVVATDVAARGLDIPHLTHVINYDFPATAEAYVHRIGRVGRAGRLGTALSFSDSKSFYLVRQVEKLTKQKISMDKIPSKEEILKARLARMKGQVESTLKDFSDLSPIKNALLELHKDTSIAFEDMASALIVMHWGLKKEDFLADDFSQPEFREPRKRQGDRPREGSTRGSSSSFGQRSGRASGHNFRDRQKAGGRKPKDSRRPSSQGSGGFRGSKSAHESR